MITDVEAGLIGVQELARKLSISVRSIWRIVGRGELDIIKIGRRSLISKAEVSRWLSGHAVQTPGATTTNLGRRFTA